MKAAPILILVAVALASPPLAAAQSLADVARHEAIRRAAVQAPGRVFTNDCLPAVPAPAARVAEALAVQASAEPEALATTAAPDTAGFDDRDESYWRVRSEGIQRQLARRRGDVAALFPPASAPADSSATGRAERALTLAALSAAQADLDALEAEWEELEKEARIAQIPPAWLR